MVDVLQDGSEAQMHLRDYGADLAILHIKLPGMDGVTLQLRNAFSPATSARDMILVYDTPKGAVMSRGECTILHAAILNLTTNAAPLGRSDLSRIRLGL